MQMTGVIRRFGARGFGFIHYTTTEGAMGEAFFHITAVELDADGRPPSPYPGDAVEFELADNPRGPVARNVRILTA